MQTSEVRLCLEMYGRYVNSSITYILVSVCLADGITSCCPIWIDTIKSIHQEEYIVLPYNTRGIYVVDTVSWPNFRLPKGSRIPRPPETWLNLS